MPADETQHQHFICLSAAVSADQTQMNRRIYFVLWFLIGFSTGLTNIKYGHSSKPGSLYVT
jgi:hypothetical protein